MSEEDKVAHEVLNHLKALSNNLILAENIHNELAQFREDSNTRVADLKENLKELRYDVKELHNQYDVMDKTLIAFQNDMAPIIEFKQSIQKQIIKYSAFAFVALLGATIGVNTLGLS